MFSLTPSQINQFKEKGWLGPLDTFSAEEIEPIREYLAKVSKEIEVNGQKHREFFNEFLGYKTTREHHFCCEALLHRLEDNRIVGRLNQLGEPNLLLWRSNIFCKLPGYGGIGWHQAIDYYGHEIAEELEQSKRTLIFPENEDALNLTVWLAIEDATLENGCLYFANGTHKHKFKSTKIASNEGAFSRLTNEVMPWQKQKAYSKIFNFDEQEWEIEPVPTKAGQILIFTERVMHSSTPNRSCTPRIGINARYVRPSVQIYPHRLKGDYIDGTGNNMEKHYSILVSGQDDYRINQTK